MRGSNKRRRKKRCRYHTGTFVSAKTGMACSYRSGWELVLMQHLDADPAVESFLYEALSIPYVSNRTTGRTRRYWPDLLVAYADGRRELIEVKPSRKLSQPAVQKKLVAARVFCKAHGLALVVITEVELRGMGLMR